MFDRHIPEGAMVWVGNFGNYVIPEEVLSEAAKASPGKSIEDRRTRGSRIVSKWASECEEHEKISLYKRGEN